MQCLDAEVKLLIGAPEVKGDYVGIEVEMEMSGPFSIPSTSLWRHDPEEESIKGHACEMLVKRPVPVEELSNTVDDLRHAVSVCGASIVTSMRASTHVHINMSDRTWGECLKFALVYHMFETVLVNASGKSRQGNLFCVRARDAEDMYDQLYMAPKKHPMDLGLLCQDSRYGSLNYSALTKFGTMEFRSLITEDGLGNIEPWVNTLLKLRDFALSCDSVSGLCEELMKGGGMDKLTDILGPDLVGPYMSPQSDRYISEDCTMLIMAAKAFDGVNK